MANKKQKKIITIFIIIIIISILCIVIYLAQKNKQSSNNNKTIINEEIKELTLKPNEELQNYQISEITIQEKESTNQISLKIKNKSTEKTEDNKKMILELLNEQNEVIHIIDICINALEPEEETTIKADISKDILGITGCEIKEYKS